MSDTTPPTGTPRNSARRDRRPSIDRQAAKFRGDPVTRRGALKCLAFGGAGTVFALAGGVFTPIDLAVAAADRKGTAGLGKPLFVQISDTHIG